MAAPVMTSRQYEANQHTLAFAQAIHAAFANNLAIVGMSLDDEYLREQITRHRGSLRAVYWFNSQFPAAMKAWADENRVTTVQVPWATFWQHWDELPVDLDERELSLAWYLAVNEAASEAEGGPSGALARSLQGRNGAVPADLARLAGIASGHGRARGESGQAVGLINGQTPREIELAVRQRCLQQGWALPKVHRTFSAGGTPRFRG